MKSKGFTLVEVLITLAIIGIVAAIMSPIIGGLIPDKNKAMVLKFSKTITDLNADMLNNSSLYYSGDTNCTGLDCQQQPLDSPYNADSKYKGATKYPYLLAGNLQVMNDPEVSGANVTFTTVDGVDWLIESATSGKAVITLDVNGSGAPNCYYSASCQKPDQFRLLVASTGKLYAGDALTEAYLKNPTKLNDKKNDLKNAEESDIDYTTGYEELIDDVLGVESKTDNSAGNDDTTGDDVTNDDGDDSGSSNNTTGGGVKDPILGNFVQWNPGNGGGNISLPPNEVLPPTFDRPNDDFEYQRPIFQGDKAYQ